AAGNIQPPPRAPFKSQVVTVKDRACAYGDGDVEPAAYLHSEETWSTHSDDLKRMPVDRYCAADSTGSAPEVRLPEAITQHGLSRTTALVVRRHKKTAGSGTNTERIKVVAAGEYAVGRIHLAALSQIEARQTPSERLGENILMIEELLPQRICKIGRSFRTLLRTESFQKQQFLRALHRKQAEHHRVD